MSRLLFSMLLLFGFSVLGVSQEKKELTPEERRKMTEEEIQKERDKSERLKKFREEIQKDLDSGDPDKIEKWEKLRLKYLKVRDEGGEIPVLFEYLRKRIFDGIAKSKTITLYEGLPHQTKEEKLLEKELATKKTIKLYDYDFYADPITPNEKDAQALLKLCQDEDAFQRYAGRKLCGGYHPDWCIEFKNGDEVYRFNLCSGCGASRIYGPKNDLYVDLRAGDLWELLEKYQKNRPKKAE